MVAPFFCPALDSASRHRHCRVMDIRSPLPGHDADPGRHDRRRLLRAFNLSLGAILVLLAVFTLQPGLDVSRLAVSPGAASAWLGLLTAPLLHGSPAHLAANAGAILILGTLCLSVYPRATAWGLPLMWLGSGLGAWWLGQPGSHHLGASGVTHGLMFMLAVLGLLRRDRASIAAGLIGFLFYGGMLITVLPHEPGVSWQSHLGGAVGGLLAGVLLYKRDPIPPRQRYSWEDDPDEEAGPPPDPELEPPSPPQVPVLWHRLPPSVPPRSATVVRLVPRPRQPPPP
jgi:membrane associated rhomboid family serine protease